MTQGLLPFQYEVDPVNSGQTALAGLPAYLDFAAVSGLTHSIRQHLTMIQIQFSLELFLC